MPTATKTRKTKTDVLNVAFVWDMSRSMFIVREATKDGTRTYLNDLLKEETKLVKENGPGIYTRFSLTAFDTVFERWLVDTPINKINVDEVVSKYHPRGWTALYDAIAGTITEVDSRLKDRENEKVLVIVMTDGQENSSQEYSLAQNGRQRLFDLIKSYEAKGNWTFVYLGANVDAFEESEAIGIPRGNAAYYSGTVSSAGAAMDSLMGSTYSVRTNASGQSSSVFADAGLSQDYREEKEKPYRDTKSATNITKKAR